MTDADKIGKLKSVLQIGKDNAIHLTDVSDKIGLPEWKVKRLVKVCRTLGVKIISSPKGYYLARNDYEFRQFQESMYKQADSRYMVVSKMIRGAVDNGKS